uniref:Secreted peptide n=1 Tax=Anopheles braziliensis TaxID=58242 RepID=A0A2M3ZLS9_9DIPT
MLLLWTFVAQRTLILAQNTNHRASVIPCGLSVNPLIVARQSKAKTTTERVAAKVRQQQLIGAFAMHTRYRLAVPILGPQFTFVGGSGNAPLQTDVNLILIEIGLTLGVAA